MNLKDLSKHLGLSQTTVSRALNGYPEVKEATRARVTQAAAELGYRANASARRLATGHSSTIGIVISANNNLLVDPHFVEFLAGVGEYLGPRDIDILVSIASIDMEMEHYKRIISEGRVDGLILSSPRIQDPRIRMLLDANMPFVLHGRCDINGAYAYLDIDNEDAFSTATQFLIETGHRRIALFNHSAKVMMFARHREMGYRSALADNGIEFDKELTCSGDMNEENGYRFTRQQLANDKPPTAIVCSSTLMGLGVSRAVEQAGLQLGKDISLITHDDGLPFLKADHMRPPLTTVRSSIREAGTEVSRILLKRIRTPNDIPERKVWPVELVVRESTGPGPALQKA
ncbi:MAG: substrate-binding domain-containing protein [Rhizobiales bacterium]|nr:substrate-binding domain-containing protein [Hyphomicrobiales bacterium]